MRNGAYCFFTNIYKNVVKGIQVQKIHYVTMVYAIQLHNYNVSF